MELQLAARTQGTYVKAYGNTYRKCLDKAKQMKYNVQPLYELGYKLTEVLAR